MSLSFSPSAASTSSKTWRADAKGLGQRLAHADGLAALAGKNERNRHANALLIRIHVGSGAKDTATPPVKVAAAY